MALIRDPPHPFAEIIGDMIRLGKKLLPGRDTSTCMMEVDHFARIFLPHASAIEPKSFDKEMAAPLPLPQNKGIKRNLSSDAIV